MQPEEWLAGLTSSNKEIDKVRAANLPKVMKELEKPLRDAAMMNATRWVLNKQLSVTRLPVDGGSGARTKMQRIAHSLPKTHYYDACCVGHNTPAVIFQTQANVYTWTALGRGNRQMAGVNAYGFPIRHREAKKLHFGFQTGDNVVANVLRGKYAGEWRGTVLTRASSYFDIKDSGGVRVCQGISHKYLTVIERTSGWSLGEMAALPPNV